MKRVPGRKAPYEIALEEEEAAARRARANPVIRDGGTLFRSIHRALPDCSQRLSVPSTTPTSTQRTRASA